MRQKWSGFDFVCTFRVNRAMFNMKLGPTGKRGALAKKDKQIKIEDFDLLPSLFAGRKQVLTWLFGWDQPVTAVVTARGWARRTSDDCF